MLFKSNSVLFPYHWWHRYQKYFEEDKILNLSFDKIDAPKLIKSQIYKIVKIKFEKSRPGKQFNNLMDALAVAQLQDLVTRFNLSNYKLPLPIFYSGNKTFKKC